MFKEDDVSVKHLFILEENMRKDVKGYWQGWLVYLDLCLEMS